MLQTFAEQIPIQKYQRTLQLICMLYAVRVNANNILYSLKFSRVKIFVDFMDF